MQKIQRVNPTEGMSIEEAKRQDKFLSQISRIAYVPNKDKQKSSPVKSDSKYKSRFFFHVDDKDELSVIEDSVKAKPKEEPINIEILKRSDSYAKELPNSLKDSITQIREFFLREIAPKSLALQSGLAQAKAVVEQQVGEVDASEMVWAEKFAVHSSKLRVLRFIKELFELTDEEAEKLYDMSFNVKQPNIFMVPTQNHESK